MKEKDDDEEEENIDQLNLNENNFNINNIISTSPSEKPEIDLNKIDNNIKIGPRMKHQKRNIKEDIELQIACEDAEERKERLMQEKLKKQEKMLKNKILVYKIDEDNYNCVDCGTPQSNFISINNGVTLCSNCAEIHKKFGHNISFVLNINDELDEYLFNFIVFGSNTKFKRFLEKENFDQNLSIKKKYKTNAVVFYRKNLKNKVEGKKLEIKDYKDPNEINENIEAFSEFDEYIIKDKLVKNGELIKQNKFINFVSKIFLGNKKIQNKKNKVLIRTKSSIKDLVKDNQEENKNKLKLNKKKNQKTLKIDNDKIKESSSRPLDEEKTEPDKNEENDENPGVYTTSEQMVNNKNDNNSE